MSKYKKNIIIFILITFSIFSACTEKDKKMKFSFEQIQNLYHQEMEKVNAKLFNLFYNKNFFDGVEEELNDLIAESDYCSVMICINIDNGIFDVRAFYNKKNEIYFKLWKDSGVQKQINIHNPSAKKILKNRPKDLVLIETPKQLVLDSTSTYIIKKIGTETYYYAYYDHSYDLDYKLLINLFREGYESSL